MLPVSGTVGDRFVVCEPAAGWHGQAIACPCVSDANAHGQTSLPMPPTIRAPMKTVPPLVSGYVGDRFVVCEPAIGTHPDIAGLVADLAKETETTSPKSRPAAGAALERIV